MYYDERGNYFDYMNQNINEETEIKSTEYDIDIKNKDYNNDYYDINNFNVYNFRPEKKQPEVTNPVNGFNRGNMFNNIYDGYKNYNYKVMVKGERDTLLLNIQILAFALNDLKIYLDLYPTDKECINLYNKYNEELQRYKNTFENKYGPITADGVKYQNEFTWIKNPWPWDKGGSE